MNETDSLKEEISELEIQREFTAKLLKEIATFPEAMKRLTPDIQAQVHKITSPVAHFFQGYSDSTPIDVNDDINEDTQGSVSGWTHLSLVNDQEPPEIPEGDTFLCESCAALGVIDCFGIGALYCSKYLPKDPPGEAIAFFLERIERYQQKINELLGDSAECPVIPTITHPVGDFTPGIERTTTTNVPEEFKDEFIFVCVECGHVTSECTCPEEA